MVGGLVWFALTGGSDEDDSDPYVVPSQATAAEAVRPDAAAAALDRLSRAIASGDADAAAALAADDDPVAQQRLAALATVARQARIGDVDLRYLDDSGGLDGSGWRADVEVTWRFEGFDRSSAEAEVPFEFRLAGADDVTIADVGGDVVEGERTPVWMSGPVTVRRTEQTLVLAVGRPRRAGVYAGLARSAVPVVREVVGDWTPRLVVEVPADLDGLDRALGADPGAYSGIAAVTTSGDGSTDADAPVHVFVNPEVFDDLRGTGAQVVMSHEATHVATQAPSSLSPTWLLEGFADYVALRDVSLPLTTTAAQIRQRVVRDGLPDSLPTAEDFDTEAPHLGAEYEAAWLLCVTLAEDRGQQALVDLYEATSRGEDLDGALERLFDWSEADLVDAWRSRLSDLARDTA